MSKLLFDYKHIERFDTFFVRDIFTLRKYVNTNISIKHNQLEMLPKPLNILNVRKL